jgi:hypothetical protein
VTYEHEFEQQLTAVLERRATQATPSPDGLRRIEDKARGRRRQRVLAIAASVLVLALVAGAVVVRNRGGDGDELNVVDEGELDGAAGLPGGDLLPALVDLETALEKEMILAAATLSGQAAFLLEWEEQVAATDESITIVEEELGTYEPSNAESRAAADSLETRLEDLETVRSGVRGEQFKTSVAIDQYLETIDASLDMDVHVSGETGSAAQYRFLQASILIGEIERETAQVGATVSAVAASSSKRFFDSEGVPCADTAAESCSSWQDVESGMHGRDELHEDLALLGFGMDRVDKAPYEDAATAAGNANTSVTLDAATVVDQAVTPVDVLAGQRLAVLDHAGSIPAQESVPLDATQLAPLLEVVERERQTRAELVDTVDSGARSELVDELAQSAIRRRELAAQVQDVTAVQRLEGLNQFLDGEAQIAAEVSILTEVVAREPQLFTPEDFEAFIEAQSEADDAFLEWQQGAKSEHKSLFRNETSVPEVRAADDMLDRAFTAGNEGRELQIDRNSWLPAALAKLGALTNVEQAIIDSLDDPPSDPSDPSNGVPLTFPDDTTATSAPPVITD